MNKIVISMILISLLFFGCTGPEEVPNEKPQEPSEDPVYSDPSITVVSPADGSTIAAMDETVEVLVSISSENLVIKNPPGPVVNGEGYFRLILDGGQPVVASSKTYTFSEVREGVHTLRVELRNNDHSSYSPPIVRDITFKVEGDGVEYIPKEYTVTIRDFTYEPEEITVNADDRVTWVNEGAYPRSATCTEVFDTEVIGPGESVTLAMEEATECEYFSLTHMAMKGEITVIDRE